MLEVLINLWFIGGGSYCTNKTSYVFAAFSVLYLHVCLFVIITFSGTIFSVYMESSVCTICNYNLQKNIKNGNHLSFLLVPGDSIMVFNNC